VQARGNIREAPTLGWKPTPRDFASGHMSELARVRLALIYWKNWPAAVFVPSFLDGTLRAIALRYPCCAQALGGHRGHPFDAIRLTLRSSKRAPARLVGHQLRSSPLALAQVRQAASNRHIGGINLPAPKAQSHFLTDIESLGIEAFAAEFRFQWLMRRPAVGA
jgi:hypothetical protein